MAESRPRFGLSAQCEPGPSISFASSFSFSPDGFVTTWDADVSGLAWTDGMVESSEDGITWAPCTFLPDAGSSVAWGRTTADYDFSPTILWRTVGTPPEIVPYGPAPMDS